jgi:hypothetical protein
MEPGTFRCDLHESLSMPTESVASTYVSYGIVTVTWFDAVLSTPLASTDFTSYI